MSPPLGDILGNIDSGRSPKLDIKNCLNFPASGIKIFSEKIVLIRCPFCQLIRSQNITLSTSNWFTIGSLIIGMVKGQNQCDQIGRFIALWATFLSLWQQLFWPSCPYIRQFY